MSRKVIKINKGEWSEFYTLLKILADQKLYAADENLQKIKDIFYPVLKAITAKNSSKEIDYELDDSENIKIINQTTGELSSVKRKVIKDRLTEVFQAIKSSRAPSFEIPIAAEVLEKLGNPVIKGYSNKKSDIVLVIHDIHTGINSEVGFSIKSQVGSASTLLNPGATTNFIYEIEKLGVSAEKINAISSRSKIMDRVKEIYNSGGSLKFVKTENKIFNNNLELVDTLLPFLMAEMLKIHYLGKATKIKDIVRILENERYNPSPSSDYQSGLIEFKIKNLLMNVALGLTPGKVWDGLLKVHGGYIVVREDGEVVCYHIYNQDAFREYLYSTTRIDTPSSSRYGFGSVYEENGKYYIKLNLQIRFAD